MVGQIQFNWSTWILGGFSLSSRLVITHVAWYDEGQDGILHSHRIGLWKDLSGATDWPFISFRRG